MSGGAHKCDLLSKVRSREAVVGVIGLGYVGLPLALAAVGKKFSVIGFDVNHARTEQLNAGHTPLAHIPQTSIQAACEAGLFEATDDFSRIQDADIIIICVPTPLGPHREPDLSYIEQTTLTIAQYLRPEQLISLESTTYPGTTSALCRPILEKRGLKSGLDFYLAFSPEREDPGNPIFSTSSIPKVVGAHGDRALEIALAFYGAIVDNVVPVASLETAEAVKITENVFRAVNIALVNELKTIYSRMDIDIFDVIDAAKTKPFGFMPFYPGPGLGGHCIPIDPFYLTWKARSLGINTRFIELAGEINSDMPRWVIERLTQAIDKTLGKAVSKSSILVIGAAYKKNVDDMRESPALVVIELLQARGATVSYHDPYVPIIPLTREHSALAGLESVDLSRSLVSHFDAVLIITDHDSVDWSLIAETASLVVDTRNVMKRNGFANDRIVSA